MKTGTLFILFILVNAHGLEQCVVYRRCSMKYLSNECLSTR
jgi:hypothetical protein